MAAQALKSVDEIVETKMQRVRLNSARVGHTYNEEGLWTGEFNQASGDEVEMPTEEAKRYLQRGLASPI